jgi:hypothetical protein
MSEKPPCSPARSIILCKKNHNIGEKPWSIYARIIWDLI